MKEITNKDLEIYYDLIKNDNYIKQCIDEIYLTYYKYKPTVKYCLISNEFTYVYDHDTQVYIDNLKHHINLRKDQILKDL